MNKKLSFYSFIILLFVAVQLYTDLKIDWSRPEDGPRLVPEDSLELALDDGTGVGPTLGLDVGPEDGTTAPPSPPPQSHQRNKTKVSSLTEQGFHRGAAICAIQKQGLAYIDEWVEYNIALGFEKLFIYDNSEQFELNDWHQNHTHARSIEIKHFPGSAAQRSAYTDCGKSIQRDKSFSWIAFIDLDEFIVINNTTRYPTIMDLLDTVPEDDGGLVLNWRMFVLTKFNMYSNDTLQPVTLRFQYRRNGIDRRVKTIARTHFLKTVGHPHFVKYNSPTASVDTSGNKVDGPFNLKFTSDVVTLHHYHTKSLQEYTSRCARGRADSILKEQDPLPLYCRSDEEILTSSAFNKQPVFDDGAWRFLKDRVPKYHNMTNH